MLSTFSKCLLFITFSTYSSCADGAKSKNIATKKQDKKNEIVIIFKKNNSSETINKFQSPIYYSENNKYIGKDIVVNNNIKDDTIKLLLSNSRICLTHNFKDISTYLYEFKKGDTVVFDYSYDLPYVKVTNRKNLKYDLNFQVDFKMEKPLGEFEFFSKFKRIRNATEKQNYLNDIKSYSSRTEKALDSLLNKNLISKTIFDLHKGRIKYYELNLNKDKFTVNSISSSDLQNDNLLYAKTYRYFLENFAVKKYNIKKINEFTYDYKELFDKITISSIFSQKVKEYLMFNSLNKIAENNSNNDLNEYFLKFQQNVDDKEVIEYFKNTYLLDFTSLKTATKDVYLLNNNKQKLNIHDVISQYKRKVVYVDFWASWCAPCRAAMKSSRKLNEKYVDKDVIFLYISIDSDFDKWTTASKTEGLSLNKNNLLALNYPKALFYKELQLKSIPRYLIYNKEGKLVHQNAPSPDSNDITIELDKYLKQ